VTYDNVAKAIGAFERKLVTPCRWDKYLGGDEQALNDVEKRGAAEFVAAGCAACHSGVLVGGGMYQKVGLVKPWPNQKDLGRFNVTKSEADKLQFKVPSLRNIARTAPYFHDGSVASLEQAIRMMGEHQLGKQLTGEQVRVIAAWLGALSGDLPQALVAEPALPPSSPSTPAPDPT
jgi:cytochrome c peroxidase